MHQARDRPSNMACSECRKNCRAARAGSGEPQVLKWRDRLARWLVNPLTQQPARQAF